MWAWPNRIISLKNCKIIMQFFQVVLSLGFKLALCVFFTPKQHPLCGVHGKWILLFHIVIRCTEKNQCVNTILNTKVYWPPNMPVEQLIDLSSPKPYKKLNWLEMYSSAYTACVESFELCSMIMLDLPNSAWLARNLFWYTTPNLT